MGGGGEWAAGGRLKHPLGLFELAIVQEVPAVGPNMLREPKRRLTTTGVNFRPMPSM